MNLFTFFSPLFSYGLALQEELIAGKPSHPCATVQKEFLKKLTFAQNAAQQAGITVQDTESASFAVVAWIDEITAAYPLWSGSCTPLQIILFQTANAGEEFFTRLNALNPGQASVREIYSMAICLGFVGRYADVLQIDESPFSETQASEDNEPRNYEPREDKLERLRALHGGRISSEPEPFSSDTSQPRHPDELLRAQPAKNQHGLHHLAKPYRMPFMSSTTSLRYLALGLSYVLFVALLGAYEQRFWVLPIPVDRPTLELAVMGLLIFWFLVGLLPYLLVRYKRHQLLKKHTEHNRAQLAALREPMLQQLQQAKKLLAYSATLRISGGDPTYRVPWFLFLSDIPAEQDHLLRAAMADSPFSPPEKEFGAKQSEYWHCWLYRDMVAIETDPSLVSPVDDRWMRGIWYQSLDLLRGNRTKLPLNGIVVLVTMGQLHGAPAELLEYASRVRRLIDEATEFLRVALPVYLVVTECDSLPGFSAFADRLPKHVAEHNLGYQLELDNDAPPRSRLTQIFDWFSTELNRLRLAALSEEIDPLKRKGIFDFVEEFRTLEHDLTAFVKDLFEARQGHPQPCWRGLYITASHNRVVFVQGLFQQTLPGDQPLARRT